MAEFCLPPAEAQKFQQALATDPNFDPSHLSSVSSAERRKIFGGLFGEDVGREINALFEEKSLRKNQQKAMLQWAQQISGLNDVTRKDIVDRILKMDKVLDGKTQRQFFEDLTRKKLGIDVNSAEAQKIFNDAVKVEQLKKDLQANPTSLQRRMNYGEARRQMNETLKEMKVDDRTTAEKVRDATAQVGNLGRSIMSTVDFSAVFNQALPMIGTKEFWNGIPKMIQYFKNEKNIHELEAWILGDLDYDLAKSAGLAITEVGDNLSLREEAFQSSIPEKLFGLLKDKTGGLTPNVPRAFNRAYTGYLNFVRYSAFKRLIDIARASGEDIRIGSKASQDIANHVNVFSGRGNVIPGLGKDKGGNWSPLLNTVLFSVRKNSSLISLMDPRRYVDPRVSPTARKAAIKQLLSAVAAVGAYETISAAMGYETDLDPVSTNFANVMTEANRFDPTGGMAKYIRLLSRISPSWMGGNREISSYGVEHIYGEGFNAKTRMSAIGQFVRNILSPTASIFVDAMIGKDGIGRPFDLRREIEETFVPMFIGDLVDLADNDPGARDLIMMLPVAMGVGMQSRALPVQTESGVTIWGEPEGTFNRTELDNELARLKVYLSMPGQTIKGVTLTEDQHKEYIMKAGIKAKPRIEQFLRDPRTQSMPLDKKQTQIKSIYNQEKRAAAIAVELSSLKSENNIFKKSMDNYKKRLGIQ